MCPCWDGGGGGVGLPRAPPPTPRASGSAAPPAGRSEEGEGTVKVMVAEGVPGTMPPPMPAAACSS